MKIVPRVYIDGNSPHIEQLYGDDILQQQLFTQLEQIVERGRFDGLVFDTPINTFGPVMNFDAYRLLENLSIRLHEKDKLLVLTLLASFEQLKNRGIDRAIIRYLRLADKLLFCMYDYVGLVQGERPIAPYEWIKNSLKYLFSDIDIDSSVLISKVMMGPVSYTHLTLPTIYSV
eukprot:TRINITY_DN7455_c0_g2_i5.p1 TRINITY_DN7455_c0_g2~~TRINITY_DN7455_c0_g2_i5.p1  ORF type:complete len:174 (-),score=41.65 TRINITY_DN7455_c0_g2_i5:36-557(-)